MKNIKILLLPLLFVSIAFFNIGGCGGSGNGPNEGEGCCVVEPEICFDNTNQIECDELGGVLELGSSCSSISECAVVPPPTPTPTPPPTPPPTPTPTECQLPPLNTDFSDLLYFFIDEPNNVAIGVSSTGEEVIIALADIVVDPEVLGLLAVPVSADLSLIDTAIVNEDIFNASGDGVRVDNGTIFQVNDLVVATIPLGVDIEGVCDSVEPLVVMTAEQSMRQFSVDISQTRGLDDNTPGNIVNFVNKLNGN